MELHKLDSNLIAKLRSSFTVNSLTQCVTELVLNSLDAKSTAIAIRINLVNLRIQVVDNGEGILKENLEHVGIRYMTNKCKRLEELEKQSKYYGFRGEALASIATCSKCVSITSRHKNSCQTFSKMLGKHSNNGICGIKDRPSVGTTITVEGFFYNLPVRKNRIVAEFELEEIKRCIESLIIMHTNISFTIRNDVTGELILNNRKTADIISCLKHLYPEVKEECSLLKISKGGISVEALLLKKLISIKYIQYVFVNKRPVFSSKIQKFVSNLIQNNFKNKKTGVLCQHKYPGYIINLKCPRSKVDILLNPTKTMVEFENWDIIFASIKKLIHTFFEKDTKLKNEPKTIIPEEFLKKECNIFQVKGAFQSYGYKKNKKEETNVSTPNELKIAQLNGNIEYYTETKDSETKQENMNIKHSGEIYTTLSGSNDMYKINDSTPMKAKPGKQIAQPLPIRVTREQNNVKRIRDIASINKNMVNNHDKTLNLPQTQGGIKSNLSKLTNDENKGKNIIMDMFLKSTQIYNSQESVSDVRSEETILEVESNLCMENNFQQNINGVSKTMSVSVNVKNTKKVKRIKNRKRRRSQYIQTTLQEKNMVSKCMQTTFSKKSKKFKMKHKIFSNGILSNSELSANYTLIFPNTLNMCDTPRFRFVHKNPQQPNSNMFNDYKFSFKKSCCCCQDHKLFHFDGFSAVVPDIHSKKVFNFDNDQHFFYSQRTCGGEKISPKHIFKTAQFSKFENNHLPEFEEQLNNRKMHNPNYNVEPYNHYKRWQSNMYNNNVEKNKLKDVPYQNFQQNIYPSMQPVGENYYDNINFNKNIAPSNYQYFRNTCLEPKVGKYPAKRNYLTHHSNMASNPLLPEQNILKNVPDRMNRIDKNYLSNWGGFIEPKSQNLPNIQPIVNARSPYFTRRLKNPLYQDYPSTYDSHHQINIKQPPLNQVNVFSICPYEKFNPVYISTQHQYNENQNIVQLPECMVQNRYQEPINSDYNDITIGTLGSFRPVHQSTQVEEIYKQKNKTDSIFSSIPVNDKSHIESLINVITISNDFPHGKYEALDGNPTDVASAEYFKKKESAFTQGDKCLIDTDNQTKLFITISNGQKKNLIENELEMEKKANTHNSEHWDNQSSELPKEALKSDGEWEKVVSDFGSIYYINKKTGFTTYFTPKLNEEQFQLCERLDFVPKGMSPILKEVKKVDKSLSQNKKDTLLEYLMETYKTELLYVKWQHYFNDMDPKTFFSHIYKAKVELYENDIPNIATSTSKHTALSNILSFDKELFSNIEIVGQVDKKFIAVLDKRNFLLILFDQHAVHERIRLEILMRAYKNSSYKCNKQIIFFIPKNDISILQKHESYLRTIGLGVDFFANGINVKEIPMSMYNKIEKEPTDCWNKILQLLINELIDLIKSSRNVLFKTYPKLLQNIINLEACTGAIKFGDILNRNECKDLLQQLNTCNLPFQCAHGRPTLTPLIHVESKDDNVYSKIDLKKLLR